ncbi:MAG: hypothetical protein II917_05755 [Synergistaceae bacterium]|nr:hypothetical protein [Synergistaceae bacterium]
MTHKFEFELDEKEFEIADTFAKECGQSISELAKVCLFDEIDLAREAEEARIEFEKDPVTYTLDEIEREYPKNAI